MSTPTPNPAGIVPSPASKKVGSASVSTPLNPYSSPAPRSVPSPAALRKDHAAKTPINHPTGSSQGSRTIGATGGATPMIASLSQQGSTASPAAGLLAGLTPTGLGVDLVGTPSGQLGTSMAISMSELGLTTSGSVKRNEDEERRVKMRKILKSIGKVKGRISEEGIARVSRRVGFANDIDAEKLSAEERERRVGNRTISIAGNTTVIDVELKNQQPRNVQVLFSSEMAGGDGQSERAGNILLEDLRYDASKALSTSLEAFSVNLARIARLDHLSSSRISCFDALSGLYHCLKRLHTRELEAAKSEHPDFSDESSRLQVMNLKSGQPAMHEHGEIGLVIQYWTSSPQAWRYNKTVSREADPHTIRIEAARYEAGLYPPIRVSDAWLPETFDLKSGPDETATIPWQDPPPTFLTPDADSMTDESTQTLPNLRFIAKLNPPVVLPWQVAAGLYSALGTTMPPLLQMPPYLSLLLNMPSSSQTHHSATKEVPRMLTDSSGTHTFEAVQHSYELTITKHDIGFVLEELPFSHPSQVIQLLPNLRQWACIGSLLQQSLGDVQSPTARPAQIQLAELLLDQRRSDKLLPIELTLATSPVPALSMAFPLQSGLCCPEVQIVENAEVHVATGTTTVGNAAAALEVVQDISLWIEWMLSRAVSS